MIVLVVLALVIVCTFVWFVRARKHPDYEETMQEHMEGIKALRSLVK